MRNLRQREERAGQVPALRLKGECVHMKDILGICLCVCLCVCCSGCASIFSDSKYVHKFEASVPDVIMDIEKNGKPYKSGVLVPAKINLPADNGYFSRADYTFTFKKGGYKDKVMTRRAKVDPFYWVNVATIYAAVIGMVIVDPWTGAMWSLEEAPVVAVMEKEKPAASPPAPLAEVKPEIAERKDVRQVPPEPTQTIQDGEKDRKCPRCGAVKGANGKCPLCDN